MEKLSLTDKIIIHCVLFLIQGLGRNGKVFYNFNIEDFICEIKKLLKEKGN